MAPGSLPRSTTPDIGSPCGSGRHFAYAADRSVKSAAFSTGLGTGISKVLMNLLDLIQHFLRKPDGQGADRDLQLLHGRGSDDRRSEERPREDEGVGHLRGIQSMIECQGDIAARGLFPLRGVVAPVVDEVCNAVSGRQLS